MTDEYFLKRLSDVFYEVIIIKFPHRNSDEVRSTSEALAQSIMNMIDLSNRLNPSKDCLNKNQE